VARRWYSGLCVSCMYVFVSCSVCSVRHVDGSTGGGAVYAVWGVRWLSAYVCMWSESVRCRCIEPILPIDAIEETRRIPPLPDPTNPRASSCTL
jgi:hypothetical protein